MHFVLSISLDMCMFWLQINHIIVCRLCPKRHASYAFVLKRAECIMMHWKSHQEITCCQQLRWHVSHGAIGPRADGLGAQDPTQAKVSHLQFAQVVISSATSTSVLKSAWLPNMELMLPEQAILQGHPLALQL